MRRLSRLARHWRLASTVVLVMAAGIFVTGILASATSDSLGFDFRFQYYDGARAVLERESLYSEPDDPMLIDAKAFIYPPPLAVGLSPVATLSRETAVIVAMAGALVAMLASLALVGVRDPRCYAVFLLSGSAWNALETVNVSALLMLGAALAWRFRGTVAPLGLSLGVSIATKLFLWPLGIWTLAMRRHGATAVAVLACLGALATSWAVVGFQGLLDYPALLRRASQLHAEQSYSFVGMSVDLGWGEVPGHVLAAVVGGLMLVGCGLRGRRNDDHGAFTYALAAAVALSPILWQHYLILLVLPFAIARPRFSPAWLLPMTLWVSPRAGNGDGLETFLPAAVAVSLVVLALVERRPGPVRAGEVAV